MRRTVAEAELGFMAVRELELDLLHCLVKLVAEVPIDDRNQGFNLLWFQGASPCPFEDLADIIGAQKREIVPALEVGVDPRGNGGKVFVERARLGVGAERWRDQLAHDASVKGVAGEPHATVAEQVIRSPAAAADRGANANEGEVAGAAAEVADEDELVVIEGGLVGIGGGDGLELEAHLLEAGNSEGFAQAFDCEGVVLFSLGADEAHRTANGGGAEGAVELLFSVLAEVAQDAGDELFEANAAAEDLGSGEQAAGQMRLEGLD